MLRMPIMLGRIALITLVVWGLSATPAHAQTSDRYTVVVEPDFLEVTGGSSVQLRGLLFRKGKLTYSSHDWDWTATGGRFQYGSDTSLPQNVWIAPFKPGEYTITVTTDRAARLGNKAIATMVVVKATHNHQCYIKIVPGTLQVLPGGRQQLRLDVCGCVNPSLVQWSCSGGQFSGGWFNAGTSPGRYPIYARWQSLQGTGWVEIGQPRIVTRIALSPSGTTISPGQAVRFQASAYDQWNRPYQGCRWEWGASGGIITPDGVFTGGQQPGRYRITVFDHLSGQAAYGWITIQAQGCAYVVLSPRVQRVRIGSRVKISAVCYDAQLNMIPTANLQFTSDAGTLDKYGWWSPVGCSPRRIYKVWARDRTTGASDSVLIYVY